MGDRERQSDGPVKSFLRDAEFWRRCSGIYASYKGAQAKAAYLRRARGWDATQLREKHWLPHHTWAGKEFYSLAVDLRGFYLKLGQFFAARAEFVPAPICKELSRLHDQARYALHVPPMSAAQTRRVIERELGGVPMDEVFEWIDLEHPLGSASIAQVHKGKLRLPQRRRRSRWPRLGFRLSACAQRRDDCTWRVSGGQDLILGAPGASRRARALLDSAPGEGGARAAEAHGGAEDRPEQAPGAEQEAAAAALRRALAAVADRPGGDAGGIVAVKVQYPDALKTMMSDLVSIRKWADFLQRTELKFDMVSAVDELAKQVRLEFDFRREAAVMDAVADDLRGIRKRLAVPRSVPGLVTQRLLVMDFLDGTPITRLGQRTQHLSRRKKQVAARMIMERVAEAFGVMILGSGLFQADAHPGNILVLPGARIGLLDYGQSKQLPDAERLAFAALVLELAGGPRGAHQERVTGAVEALGLRFARRDPKLITRMAFGMFDTRTSHRVDPFSPDSPIKALAVEHFPGDIFFVLRVMQLLRGLAGAMGVEHSTAHQWAPLARAALSRAKHGRQHPEPLKTLSP